MTTPEIDVAPSTVEGGDKSGSNFPVDAAPPKDPIAAFEHLAAIGYGVRLSKEQTAALASAVASLRARAEEAEDDRYHLQGRLKEACARHERVASSLERMRERVAGLLTAMRCEAERGFIYGHARTTPDWAEAVNRYGRAIADLRRALDASSPFTPETKDEHR